MLLTLASTVLLCASPALSFSSLHTAQSPEERATQIHQRYVRDTTVDTLKRASSPDVEVLYETRFENTTWDATNWILSTSYLDQGHYQSRMSVANGYIGINVAAAGPFFEVDTPVDGDNINGWPLFQRRQTFATIGGFFDSQPTTNGTNYPWLEQYGGESVISGVPHWGGLVVESGEDYLDASVDPATVFGFSSSLDFKGGVFTWKYTWTPANTSFEIEYTMFAHKVYVNQAAVQLSITASGDADITIANVLDGTAAVRTDFVDKGSEDGSIWSAVSPLGLPNVTAYIYANMTGTGAVDMSTLKTVADKPYAGTNESSIVQTVSASLKAGETTTITKFVGAASSDGFDDPQATAKTAAMQATSAGYSAMLKSHLKEWATIFTEDSVDSYSYPNDTLPNDPNILESSIAAITNPFYLLQNTLGQNAMEAVNNASINSNSISVGGLTSDSYAGQVFWDAEIWMQPGLVASHPYAAQGIANFRVARYTQALANVETAYQSSKNDTSFSDNAAVFPWTDGRFGNCTAVGPCFDYEYHLNGDIAMEFANYWVATGDTSFFNESLFPIYDSIATFYAEVVEKNESTGGYSLFNMTDPDEYANQKDDGGFTMPLISDTLTNANFFRGILGYDLNETYAEVAANVNVVRDDASDITLEYSTMNGSISVKQADVILDTYPLGYSQNYSQADALSDLDYYANKQSANGPGMTYAIFSIVANDVSPSGCSAYTYDLTSTQPYIRGPWFQFSEQLIDDYTSNGGTHPAYPFLTGHGGSNQVALFGYLGLRLYPSFTLQIDPNLPPQIPYLRYRTFYWQGWPIQAASNYTHTILERTDLPLSTANTTFATTPIPIQVGPDANSSIYSLPLNTTLTIPNRRVADTLTLQGNLLQCPPIVGTNTSYVHGQFPLAAVDGASSTKWQPESANDTASITITLNPSIPYQQVTSFYFDWALAPPVSATVYLHNTTSHNGTDDVRATSFSMQNISIEYPYDAASAADIVAYKGNTTNVTLTSPIWTGRFATLEIRGNQALEMVNNGSGATVAEFAVLGMDGVDLVRREQEMVGDERKEKRKRDQVFGRYGRYMGRDVLGER